MPEHLAPRKSHQWLSASVRSFLLLWGGKRIFDHPADVTVHLQGINVKLGDNFLDRLVKSQWWTGLEPMTSIVVHGLQKPVHQINSVWFGVSLLQQRLNGDGTKMFGC